MGARLTLVRRTDAAKHGCAVDAGAAADPDAAKHGCAVDAGAAADSDAAKHKCVVDAGTAAAPDAANHEYAVDAGVAADSGDQVQVCTADRDGSWGVLLQPSKAGGPYTMTVSAVAEDDAEAAEPIEEPTAESSGAN